MFNKKLNDLTIPDIERIISEGFQEGSQVEFKSALPANKGQHPWYEGGDTIGEKARNRITEELIAFANAHGGTLVLGIEESNAKPARAAGIKVVPRCAELAERLRQACSDCIDPRLPVLEVEGIPVDNDGSGVIVFQVPHSRLAPHRHKITKECYYRRADRSEAMTMREIQDLTLFTERGMAAIEKQFNSRREKFADWFRKKNAGVGSEKAFGIRVTAFPLTPIHLERVHKDENFKPPIHSVSFSLDGNDMPKMAPWRTGHDWRPILRGTVQSDGGDDSHASREVHCNGLIEYQFALFSTADDADFCIYPEWFLALVPNVILAIERFRSNADLPGIEYALEIEVNVADEPIPVVQYNCRSPKINRIRGCELPKGDTTFPRYSVGATGEFQSLGSLIERDFWNYAGADWENEIKIDFDTALQELGLAPAPIEDVGILEK